jgi:serine/threonine protein kinase
MVDDRDDIDKQDAVKVTLPSSASGAEARLTEELPIATMIADRYKILRFIGRGGMGSVYQVEQVFMKKKLALKTLNKVAGADKKTRQRFKLEALAASKLEHPNLVRALDYGWLETKQPFLVMDFIEGESLEQYFRRTGKISPELAAKIFIPVSSALAYAHAKGVIHRDLKPGNIMLVHSNNDHNEFIPKVVDFGIAKLDEREANALTKAGEIIGTPLYMSPEQAMGALVDNRSDIYSLGCVMYEALTGTPPFQGTVFETMMQHKTKKPLPMKEASSGVEIPAALEKIVLRMMAKKPEDRYSSCADVAQDLLLFSHGARLDIPLPEAFRKAQEIQGRIWQSIWISVFLLCVATGIVFGIATMLNAPPKGTTNMGASHPEQSEKMFSRLVGDPPNARVFNFGGLDLGEIGWQEKIYGVNPGRTAKKATGEVSIPINVPYIFWGVNFEKVCENPGLLSKFRDDELSELRLKYTPREKLEARFPDRVFDETLSFASHLKSLKSLEISSAPVSIRGLENLHIDELTKFIWLNISSTNIDGADLARHQQLLRGLSYLNIGGLKNLRPVLKSLEGSKRIEHLCMRETGARDSDIAYCNTMPNLNDLDMRDNSDLTDAALKPLLQLNRLLILRLPRSITPKAADTLGKFKWLQILEVTNSGWKESDTQKLHALLPNCKVVFPQSRNQDLLKQRAKGAMELFGPQDCP